MNKIIIISFLQFLASVLCFATEVTCPLKLETTEQRLPTVLDGWEARQMRSQYLLNGVEISFGDPALSSGAIYDDDKTIKTKSGDEVNLLIWDLRNVKDPYLACTYYFTSVALIRSLKGLSKCEVRSVKKRGFNRYEIESAKCY